MPVSVKRLRCSRIPGGDGPNVIRTCLEETGAPHTRRFAGFTLIELLVVVAIIALLVSILLPSLARARDQARGIKCLANMRDMATGVNTFASNHRGRFQLVTIMGATAPTPTGVMRADPQKTIYEYESGPNQGGLLLVWPIVLLREQGIRNLRRNLDWGPTNEATARTLASRGRLRRFEVLSCPSDKVEIATPFWPNGDQNGAFWGYLSYGINEDIAGAPTFGGPAPVWKNGNKGSTAGGGERLQGQLDKVVRPSEVAFFADMGPKQANQFAGSASTQNLLLSKDCHGPLLEYFYTTWPERLWPRHRGARSVNITYADCHGGLATKYDPRVPPTGIEPNALFLPKTRVSPYDSGYFPVQ